jgi:hypothetical protein
MTFDGPDVRRAAASRDAALARLRRGTAVVAGASVALTAAFAGLAAGFTSGNRHSTSTGRTVRRATTAPVVAPAPKLVSVGSGASSASAPPAVSAAPPAAAPVVVSGGS